MNKLEQEIKELIITSLNLEDISANDINSEDSLFDDGLGLDSIDALEIGMALQQTFKVDFKAESEGTMQHFKSVKTLAEFITRRRQT